LTEFGRQIKWQSLPKSFQDAVVFTRRLGIRYLWIDSLCIIQDSKEDWETQAAKMAMIYALAVLTLSAVNAEDSSVGCFVQPPALSTRFITNGETTVSLEDTTAAANFLSDQKEDVKVLVRELVEHLTPSRGSAAKIRLQQILKLARLRVPADATRLGIPGANAPAKSALFRRRRYTLGMLRVVFLLLWILGHEQLRVPARWAKQKGLLRYPTKKSSAR
jgi:hypothetical protein